MPAIAVFGYSAERQHSNTKKFVKYYVSSGIKVAQYYIHTGQSELGWVVSPRTAIQLPPADNHGWRLVDDR